MTQNAGTLAGGVAGGQDVQAMPGHLVRRLHQLSVSIFRDRVQGAGFDITPVQYGALKAIEANPGLDQATLAGVIAYDQATIAGVINRLEAKGFARRATAPDNRRARHLFLLPAGLKAIAKLDPLVLGVQADMLAGLSATERAQLTALLAKAADVAGGQTDSTPDRRSA